LILSDDEEGNNLITSLCNLCDMDGRGDRSQFFRLRSCSKIFESGSVNFSNLRIRLLFRIRLQSSIQP